MKTFTFALQVEVEARDEEAAADIAGVMVAALVTASPDQPFKVNSVEVTDLEES